MALDTWYDNVHDVQIVVDPEWHEIDFTGVPGEPPAIAIDVETCEDNPDRMHLASGYLRVIGFSFNSKTVYLLRWLEYDDSDSVFQRVVDYVTEHGYQWVIHNAGFDLPYLALAATLYNHPAPEVDHGSLIVPACRLKDTRLIERALYSNWFSAFSLRAVVARRFDVVLKKDTRDEFVKMVHTDALTMDQLGYAALDVAYTHRVYSQQRAEILKAGDGLKRAILTDAGALRSTLHFTEAPVSEALWDRQADLVLAELAIAERKVPVNTRSPKQVMTWLQKCGVPCKSSSAKELKHLAKSWEPVRNLLEVRRLSKLASSYGKSWLQRFVQDGRVQPSFNVYGAVTSRWSSANPNLQQIPRGEFRKMFIAPKGYKWVIADYSQQEVWVAAYFARDQKLLRLLGTGDVYTEVGRLIYNDASLSKSDPRRQFAKSAVLGLLYGLTPRGMAKNQQISVAQAQAVFDGIEREFPALWHYIHTHTEARKRGYTETALGHRYWINPFAWNWRNNAANSPVQGTGSDMVKLAVTLYTEKRPGEIALVVHDEIAALVPESKASTSAAWLEECMAEAFNACLPGLNHPKPAVAHIGESWADKE